MLKDKSARRHRSSGRPGVENTEIRNVRSQSAYQRRPKKNHMAKLAHAAVEVMVSSGSAIADTLRYHSVGYMQIILECMRAQAGTIYGQEKAIDYASAFVFIEVAKDCDRHMSGLLALGGLTRPERVRIYSGAKVLCFERANGASGAARAAIVAISSSSQSEPRHFQRRSVPGAAPMNALEIDLSAVAGSMKDTGYVLHRIPIPRRRSSIATHGVCMDLFELAKELEAQFN